MQKSQLPCRVVTRYPSLIFLIFQQGSTGVRGRIFRSLICRSLRDKEDAFLEPLLDLLNALTTPTHALERGIYILKNGSFNLTTAVSLGQRRTSSYLQMEPIKVWLLYCSFFYQKGGHQGIFWFGFWYDGHTPQCSDFFNGTWGPSTCKICAQPWALSSSTRMHSFFWVLSRSLSKALVAVQNPWRS